MGEALVRLGWPRWSYVLTTKLYWGIDDESAGINVNVRNTLNRKYLQQAIDRSLERLGHDFVDVLYCHRPDPHTPIGETVWAMSDIIAAGRRTTGARASGRPTTAVRRSSSPAPPPARPGHRAVGQPVPAPHRDRVRPAQPTTATATRSGPAGERPVTGKYRDGVGGSRARSPATAEANVSPTLPPTSVARLDPISAEPAVPWRSWRSPGAPPTPTSRR